MVQSTVTLRDFAAVRWLWMGLEREPRNRMNKRKLTS